jgi:hypothetical protein
MFARRVIDVRSEVPVSTSSPFGQPAPKLSLRLSAVNFKLLVNLADSGQPAECAATNCIGKRRKASGQFDSRNCGSVADIRYFCTEPAKRNVGALTANAFALVMFKYFGCYRCVTDFRRGMWPTI